MSTRGLAISICLFALARCAIAQDFLHNSSFDVDAAAWTTTAFSDWSNMENHGGSSSGASSGSLEISALDMDSASQCVPVVSDTTYVLQSWIEKNPSSEFRPCDDPSWNIQITWLSDSICTNPPLGTAQMDSSDPIPLGWYGNVIVAMSPDTANSALVTLQSTCAAHNGTSTFFFDDVTFMLDTVFRNDFEVHAHEGGPEEP